MLDPLEHKNKLHLDALRKKRRTASRILALRKIVTHSWRPVFWTLLFFGLWMLGIPAFLGTIVTYTTPFIFVIGLFYLLRKDIGSLTFNKAHTIDYALETNSALPRGQIKLIEDKLANPKTQKTRELWKNAQNEGIKSFSNLKVPHLNVSLSRQDPSALRFIAILIFISGLMMSGPTWKDKILSGLVPIIPESIIAQGHATNLWITPPEYTQMGQIHVVGSNLENPLSIPEGSTIKIRIHSIMGESFPPWLHNGDEKTQMTYLNEGLYGIETTINQGNTLSIKQAFIPRANWQYDYITDTPPEIALDIPEPEEIETTDTTETETVTTEPFEILENAQIKFPLKVKDDYGVKELKMTLNIDPVVEERPLGKPASEIRLIMSQPNIGFKIAPIYDMTWHTWAGLPVTFVYEAIDHKGQTATLDEIKLTLPERTFEHPVAKSLIKMRKKLAWEYDSSFAEISYNLETLLDAPDYLQDNPVIYLSIKTAASRLRYNNHAEQSKRLETAEAVINLLWYTALAIEEGNLSLALRELRDAQRALENAMRDPKSSEEEIAALMDELREKMANYFTEMQREVQKRLENGEELPTFSSEDFGDMISPDALANIMEQIEQALRDGDQAKAEELMSQLQRMMEMLDPNMTAQLPPDMQMMQEGVNELQELIERQEALRDQTAKQAEKQTTKKRKQDFAQNKPKPLDLQNLEEMLKDFGFDSFSKPQEETQQEQKQSQSQNLEDKQTAKNSTTENNSDKEQKQTQQNTEQSDAQAQPQPNQNSGQKQNDQNKNDDNSSEQTAKQNQENDQGTSPNQENDNEADQQAAISSPQQENNSAQGTQSNKTEQEALRYVLGQLMLDAAEKLNEVPETMGLAEQEMRGSEKELNHDNPRGSLPHQDQAIEHLKDAQENLSQQFRQRMQQMVGVGLSGGPQQLDPLGRPLDDSDEEGRGHDSHVQVPDEAQKKRVDEILRELRERSGDRSRSSDELDYLKRLLRQF